MLRTTRARYQYAMGSVLLLGGLALSACSGDEKCSDRWRASSAS